jgi:hypothetical protein
MNDITEAPPAWTGRQVDAFATALLEEFESCGENCEFGLLRWAFCAPNRLVQMLEADIVGFGDNVTCSVSPFDELVTKETTFGVVIHTTVKQDSVENIAEFTRSETKRMQLLGRLFAKGLRGSGRIYVCKMHAEPTDALMSRLLRAFSTRPARLLIVLPTDSAMSVRLHSERVAIGRMTGLGPSLTATGTREWNIPFQTWVDLCADAQGLLS